MSEHTKNESSHSQWDGIVQGAGSPRQVAGCNFVRILPVCYALGLLLTLAFILSAFAPALAGEEPPNFDKAALRAEAEAMLLPHQPNDFVPLPDIWKLRCGSLEPMEREVPSYYGTPLPEGLDGCYSLNRDDAKGPHFSPEEVARFDPSTIPNPIILEPSFALYKGMDFQLENRRWYDVDIPPMWDLVRKAKEGNPLAALRMAGTFKESHLLDSFECRSHFFWVRMADALTRPGWGYEVDYDVDKELRGFLGWPLSMMELGGKVLNEVPDSKNIYLAWMRECALRGRAFVWSAWTYMYAYNTAGVSHPEGVLDKPYPTKGYAMALAGSRMPQDMGDNARYTQECILLARHLKNRAAQLGVDVARGQALADELYAVYEENQRSVLEEQRRHRAEALPEVNRQIDAWLKEVEIKWPNWLKKEWPEYPAYGDEHE